MRQTWRWFGPDDIVPLAWVRQAGADGIVTACHQFAPGTAWTSAAIAARKAEIEAAGLTWDVVESVPVSEAIKTAGPECDAHLDAYAETLRRLAEAEGPEVVCYNFMPVLDWTRTDTDKVLPHGGTAMAFEFTDFVAFDLFILKRKRAADDYAPDVLARAEERFAAMSNDERTRLGNTVGAGLPGANDFHALDALPGLIDTYAGIGADGLRANLAAFLERIVPVAEELGLRLCAHPDDPPFPILGLPRILSNAEDYQALLDMVPSQANGVTLCTGSLGVLASNDMPAFTQRFAGRIHFAHLRNTTRSGDAARPDFFEDAHLEGDTDMVAVLRALRAEETRRKAEGRTDWEIPMRPDHGHRLMSDLERPAQPGYPAVGRLRGLAELRGILHALGAG
ncbi:mannonate dehydratase [Pseudaestuariivita sp.]|uniref:mannonate dehydratase n=1 Tax=Pseudaestuariivita sp. TaxID=2211669 RepID=UPI0040599755